MTSDIFKYWSVVGPSDRVHPRDRDVLHRIDHGFDLRCLPGCFGGPLRTAPIVLLYLSPGFHPQDLKEAKSPERQARKAEQRKGRRPLPGPEDHEPAWRWWSSRTKYFGLHWETLQDKVAVLNIAGYHAKSFSHWNVLAALPSCRATLDWAHDVLFPQAEAGDRVVICMRAAPYWGLGKKQRYGQALFAPPTTRGGFPLRSSRREIAALVSDRLAHS